MKTQRLGYVKSVFLQSKAMWVSALQYCLTELEVKAQSEGMQIAWDSLEISTEREEIEEQTLSGNPYPVYSYNVLRLNALAVDPHGDEEEKDE